MTTKTIKKQDIEQHKLIILVLLILSFLFCIYLAFFKQDALDIEILKSGGKENFSLLKKIYTHQTFVQQQQQSLQQIFSSLNGQEVPDTQQETAETPSVLNNDTIQKILNDTFIKGNKNARFVILEYSDFLCPFCQRHHNNKTLQKIQEKYPNDVALLFKNMPLVQLHPSSPKGAEAAECAGKLGGSNVFYSFVDEAFTQSSFDDEVITRIANTVNINSKKLLDCVHNGEFTSKIDSILEEASTIFAIHGTPGNVILDKKTGKYVIVSGAYPFEKFDTELQNLMKE